MSTEPLPETAAVYWRPRVDAQSLARRGRLWTLTTVAHTVPYLVASAFLLWLEPLTAPVVFALLAHAWVIPELYAKRGANVLRARPRADERAERTALGLLGDLVGHEARELHARTGAVVERGRLGVWVVGESGAILVVGRRAYCWCVRVEDGTLPSADRIAHLLLALRTDEAGFATVANLAFSGAPRRVRRRLPPAMRPALDAGVSTGSRGCASSAAKPPWRSARLLARARPETCPAARPGTVPSAPWRTRLGPGSARASSRGRSSSS